MTATKSSLCCRLLGYLTSRNASLLRRHTRRRRVDHFHHRYYFGGAAAGEGESLLRPAGLLFDYDTITPIPTSSSSSSQHTTAGNRRDDELDAHLLPKGGNNLTERVKPLESEYFFIPEKNNQSRNAPNDNVREIHWEVTLCGFASPSTHFS